MIFWYAFIFLSSLSSIVALLLFLAPTLGTLTTLMIFTLLGLGAIEILRWPALRSSIFCTGTKVTLHIQNTAGDLAKVTKQQTFVSLWNHITRFDGTIKFDEKCEDLCVNILDVNSDTRLIEKRPGFVHYAQEFNQALRPFRKYKRTVSYNLVDCFRNNREFFEIDVLHPGINLSVEILFPVSRPPTNVCVRKTSGFITSYVKDLTLQDSGFNDFRMVQFTPVWIEVGKNYRIEWNW